MKAETKTFNGCSIKFSITIKEGDSPKELLTKGNYLNIGTAVHEIIDSLRNEDKKEETMDVELVEFEGHPEEEDIQKEFVRRGLLFPEYIDALRFGAKYPEMGDLDKTGTCCVIFPRILSPNTRISRKILAINYINNRPNLCMFGFGTKFNETWYFAGLRPRKK